MRLIAIDGPAGSGKSTVARAVASQLGVAHLDTGAMYRSVAVAVLRRGIDPEDGDRVAEVAAEVHIEIQGDRVMVDQGDVTAHIRSPDVTRAVSAVSSHPAVRQEMVRRQREWARAHSGGVVEGRDIGSVVFPDADLKVYLTASDEVRAERRSKDSEDQDVEAVAAELARRDRLDSTRSESPLAPAADAVVIDTSDRTVDEVVEEVIGLL
ncbi:MAG TPA: (d)CMP kinase [Acidimicrobiales bacterium]|nr:(d)CMP kinase [Acidimicrobiales bacterium]